MQEKDIRHICPYGRSGGYITFVKCGDVYYIICIFSGFLENTGL